MLSMSAHKFNGPKGVGALYVKKGIDFKRFLDGGHQEKNKRSSTENIAGIVGMGKAAELARINLSRHTKYLKDLRDYFICQVEEKISDVQLNGSRDNRLPGNCNISFKDVEGGALLLKLDEKGICASAGSACSSQDSMPSHVLLAIGLPSNWANGSLRVTFGDDNTKEDVDFLVETLKNEVEALRKMK